MQNSYVNVPSIVVGNQSISNIFPTTKNIALDNQFIIDNSHMWYYRDIEDDTRLELLAYEEYEDSKLWDLLARINQMESLFDLPTNGDNIIAKANTILSDMEAKIGVITDAPFRLASYFRLIDELTIINDKHRKFRFVKQSYISQLIGLLNG